MCRSGLFKNITLICSILLVLQTKFAAQVNFVNNPSFEMRCGSDSTYFWTGADSANCTYFTVFSECSSNNPAPKNNWTYQYAHTGKSYLLGGSFAFDAISWASIYYRNRLASPLMSGVTYCVRYYVNLTDISTVAFDGYDVYFGNAPDTISGKWACLLPITFLTPQISNPYNNIIADTMNWTAMSGTFTASGGEKYMVFGNLRGTNVNTLSIYTNTALPNGQEICLDDFSVVDINLPADAGPDKHFFVGDNVYIGRPLDVGTDYACTWYQLPFTNIPMPGVSGMWVKPVQTTTFVVAQQLWCSGIKYDTVVVYRDAIGIRDLDVYLENVKLFPNPASSNLSIQFTQPSTSSGINRISVYNQLGQNVPTSAASMAKESYQVDCSTLSAGLYFLRFELESGGSFVKRFVVEH